MGSSRQMTWPEIRQNDEYRGRWVALDNCTYDQKTAQPIAGSVVDVDDDLVGLCYGSQDFREGIESFLAKRPPKWTGR